MTSPFGASLSIGFVDAFVGPGCGGNEAAVVVHHLPIGSSDMALVAAHLGRPETAFVQWRTSGVWSIRWFTPTVEVELCGHATLAAAHWLWEQRLEREQQIIFQSSTERLTASRLSDGRVRIELPVVPFERDAVVDGLQDCFPGVKYEYLGCTSHTSALERNVGLRVSPADLRYMQPNLKRMLGLPVGGFAVTALSDVASVHFISRYFGPACGIDEDPVTGSAHCSLVAYWHRITGRRLFSAMQVSERGGLLDLHLRGDDVVSLTGLSRSVSKSNLDLENLSSSLGLTSLHV